MARDIPRWLKEAETQAKEYSDQVSARYEKLLKEAPPVGELTWDYVNEVFKDLITEYEQSGKDSTNALDYARGVIQSLIFIRMVNIVNIDESSEVKREDIIKESQMLKQWKQQPIFNYLSRLKN